MNIKEIFNKITKVGKILVEGRPITAKEFEKLIPKEKIKELSDMVSKMPSVPTIPDMDDFEDVTGGSMLTQDQIRDIPVVVEFVAVPSTFDIELALSMRESAGMFDGKETNLEHVKFIAETIKASPYMVLAKTPEVTVQSAFFCLEIFRELGLRLDTNYSDAHDSKFRGRKWDGHAKYQYSAGHIAQRAFLVVIVNLYKFVEEGLITKIADELESVQERIDKLAENMQMLDEK